MVVVVVVVVVVAAAAVAVAEERIHVQPNIPSTKVVAVVFVDENCCAWPAPTIVEDEDGKNNVMVVVVVVVAVEAVE